MTPRTRTRFSRALSAALLSLVLLTGCPNEGTVTSHAPESRHVTDCMGGLMSMVQSDVEDLESSKSSVRLSDSIGSACTLYLGVQKSVL